MSNRNPFSLAREIETRCVILASELQAGAVPIHAACEELAELAGLLGALRRAMLPPIPANPTQEG